MLIGINATAAFKHPRCGVEEYSYQLIKHLTMLPQVQEHRFFLYVPKNLYETVARSENFFWQNLPKNFTLKPLSFPIMWTQIRLSCQMLFNPPEVLFIPVHVLPLVHPKNSIVTVQGLEYEYYPEMYPVYHLKYLRWSTKYAVRRAKKVLAASESTKNDLMKFYQVPVDKIEVVYHGFVLPESFGNQKTERSLRGPKPYLLYLGRIELKKNIAGLIKAFEILKKNYQIPHELVLAGADGYGAENLKFQIQNSRFKNDIILTGYLNEREKERFLQNADLFLFPSFYEGFGLPILEAQSYEVPVVTSSISSMPEVAGQAAILVDPHDSESIAQGIYLLLNNKSLRDKLINQGLVNLKRFSWQKCAQKTLKALLQI